MPSCYPVYCTCQLYNYHQLLIERESTKIWAHMMHTHMNHHSRWSIAASRNSVKKHDPCQCLLQKNISISKAIDNGSKLFNAHNSSWNFRSLSNSIQVYPSSPGFTSSDNEDFMARKKTPRASLEPTADATRSETGTCVEDGCVVSMENETDWETQSKVRRLESIKTLIKTPVN